MKGKVIASIMRRKLQLFGNMCQVKDDHLLKTMLFSIKEDQIKKQTIQWYSATRAYRHFMLKGESEHKGDVENNA